MRKEGKLRSLSGLLALLLVVISLPVLKTAFAPSLPADSPCTRPVWIELAGDIAIPGVYQVCRKAEFVQVITRSTGSKVASSALLRHVRWPLQNGWKWDLRRTRDGWHITGGDMSAFQKHTLGLPLSLNRETREGLTALPGIGDHLAEAIIRERDKRGGFRSLDELRYVNGLGEKILRKIRPHLTLF